MAAVMDTVAVTVTLMATAAEHQMATVLLPTATAEAHMEETLVAQVTKWLT